MDILREQSEVIYAQEIEELKKQESGKKPHNWQMTPQSVLTYLMGGQLSNGFEVSTKYIG